MYAGLLPSIYCTHSQIPGEAIGVMSDAEHTRSLYDTTSKNQVPYRVRVEF